MAELVTDCPRCGADKITFDVTAYTAVGMAYEWQRLFEAFAVCRHCGKATIFQVKYSEYNAVEMLERQGLLKVEKALNKYVAVYGHISIKDEATFAPPEYVPDVIAKAFREGATAYSVDIPNAAGTMFRLCVDLATRPLLPEGEVEGLTNKIRRDLGLRLPWLFDHGRLDPSLRDLSTCIKDDGNDGAHQGTLTMREATDLAEFTTLLLRRMYTEPEKLKQAALRREERRAKAKDDK